MKRFQPWRQDALRSYSLRFVLAPAVLFAGIYGVGTWGAPPWVAAVAALLAVAFFVAGSLAMKRSGSRRYGKSVEDNASLLALRTLEQSGYRVERGRMTRCGDVDLIVETPSGLVCVEIKSFWYWRSRWRDVYRQRRARRQARAQARLTGAAHAVIWLPNARSTAWSQFLDRVIPERFPTAVRGNSTALLRHIYSTMG